MSKVDSFRSPHSSAESPILTDGSNSDIVSAITVSSNKPNANSTPIPNVMNVAQVPRHNSLVNCMAVWANKTTCSK